MNKVATYLNEHLLGRVVTDELSLRARATDGGILARQPEMVAEAVGVNDLRKLARFCSQLADKGHILPITVRGNGTDGTGGAIGGGISLDMRSMNHVLGIDPKQQLIHIQAGAPYSAVQMALATHKGLSLPAVDIHGVDGTIGGAIASGAVGRMSRLTGTLAQSVQQLEIVLANGEVLQTGRISKRELGRKKGLQTMEGEIYRRIDNLISDKRELIDRLATDEAEDTSGYCAISRVKRRDGSFDLTPLFIGSQGTLGIIAEVIVKAQYARTDEVELWLGFSQLADAQAAADVASSFKDVTVELFEGDIIASAVRQGKLLADIPVDSRDGAVLVVTVAEFSEKAARKIARKIVKKFASSGVTAEAALRYRDATEPSAIESILALAARPSGEGDIVPQAFRGLWIPHIQLDGFIGKIRAMESTHAVTLPLYIDRSMGFVDLMPVFSMKKVTDRQKIVKLLAELAAVVAEAGGSLAGRGGDGSLKAGFIRQNLDEAERELYDEIRQIFDPQALLNPGVKQDTPVKELAAQINAWCHLRN